MTTKFTLQQLHPEFKYQIKACHHTLRTKSNKSLINTFGYFNPCSLHTCVVQRSQDPQLVHGVEHVVFRWWIHEVEEEQILNAKRLQQQDYVGQVGPLDLWDGARQHLILIGALSVEPERRGGTRTETGT